MGRAEIVRAAAAAFNEGDEEGFLADVHPEIEWVEDANYPGGTTYRGPDGVRESIRKWHEAWAEMRTSIERIEERGDTVVALGRTAVKATTSGIAFESEYGSVYEFEDGLVRRVRLFNSHAKALEAAGF